MVFVEVKILRKEATLMESLKEYENKEELWTRKKKEHEELEAKEKQ